MDMDAAGRVTFPARMERADADGILLHVEGTPCEAMLDGAHVWEAALCDARCITPRQRMAIYATIRDVSRWSGYDADDAKAALKCAYACETGQDPPSFAGCSVSAARDFLGWLLDFCVIHGIPASESLLARCEDVSRYVYTCLLHKVCCVTGRRAQLHHVDAVGMGRDRETIVHLGMRVLPLCAEKHQEAHTLGNSAFCQKYGLAPVEVDRRIAAAWRLRTEKKERTG